MLSEFSVETEKVDGFLEVANTIWREQQKAVKRINHKAGESHMIDGVESGELDAGKKELVKGIQGLSLI